MSWSRIDLSGTIDVAAERARLTKDLAAAQKEREVNAGKLANEAFTTKAPEAVIGKVRDRLAAAEADLDRIAAALQQLPESVDWLVVAVSERERYAGLLRQIEAEIFGRRGEGHINPTNERMEALVRLLGDPQRTYRGIHLTGTNGKTSTARMVEELLRGFGLRTGRYTSPHLTSVTERIVLDGEPVSARTFVEAYRELAPYIELVDGQFADDGSQPEQAGRAPLSFFEIVTALAFAVFADAPVDVAVVEVGMGGTWDNTNVLDAEVAVVLPVDLDHTQYLGTTIEQIATEKAGIIKPGASAILAAQPPEAAAPLLRRAAEVEAAVAREGLEFGVLDRRVAVGGQALRLQGLGGVYDEVFVPLHGAHQAQNAACALAAVEAFFGAGAESGPLDLDLVRGAFAAVRSPARLEAVRSAPTILLDAAHNRHGMQAAVGRRAARRSTSAV